MVSEGSTAERIVDIEEPYRFVHDLMDVIAECLRLNGDSITGNTCNSYSISDAGGVVSMLRTLTEVYFYLKHRRRYTEDRDLHRICRSLFADPTKMLGTVRTLLIERRSFYFLYGLYVMSRKRLTEGEGVEAGTDGKEVTVLEYRYLKVDVIFNQDGTARVSAAMLRDYQGAGAGRIIP